MKYTLYLAVFLLTMTQAMGQATVKGYVSDAKDTDILQLIVNDDYLGFDEQRKKVELKDGKFDFKVDVSEPTVAKLVLNNTAIPLYLEPEDDIQITFEADSILTNVAFEGTGAANNDFYHRFMKNFGKYYSFNEMEDVMKETMVDVFEMELFETFRAQNTFKEANLDKFDHSKGFQKFITTQIRYNYLHNLYAYPIITGNANKTKMTVEPLPRVMTDVVKDEWVNQSDNMISDQYRGFVNYFMVYKTSEANDFKKFKDHTTSIENKYVYARQQIEGDVFCWFLAKYLQDSYKEVKPSSVRWLFNDLAENDEADTYKSAIENIIGERMAEEDPIEEEVAISESGDAGKGPAIMRDMDGNPVRFEDFKGKVVYVDFWASWCGPCRKQFPFAAELKHKIYDNLSKKQKDKIVFLYISIDDTEAGWKKAVEQMKLEGFQVHSPGGWNSKIIKQFKITGIPRYMIIDKKGNFVNQNAPRPSDGTIFDTLMNLIEN